MIHLKVISYDRDHDEFVCQRPSGSMIRVDPFVGEALPPTETPEQYIGKTFVLAPDFSMHFINDRYVYLPSKDDLKVT